MTAANALAASLRPVASGRADLALHSVLLVGAAGRLGEAVLTALLAAPDVARIEVATTAALPSSHHKLSYTKLSTAASAAPLKATCAVIVLGAAPASYYGRDRVFAQLEEDQLLAWCEALHKRGLERLVLVSPTQAHLQSMSFDGLVFGTNELQLVRWFASLTVIRPADTRKPNRSGASFGQRIGFFVRDQLSQMLPAHQQQSDKKRVAALVCEAIGRDEPGVKVFDSIDTAVQTGRSPVSTGFGATS